jgi:hypothetical protein
MTVNGSPSKSAPVLTTSAVVFGVIAAFLLIDDGIGLAISGQITWRIIFAAVAVVLCVACLVLRRRGSSVR